MDARLKAFFRTAERAVQFQLRFQQRDGSLIWDQCVRDAYHKQPYSWGISGHLTEAHRLISWIRDNALQPDGSLLDYGGDVYKLAWLFQGCHRIGRFDVSYPVMQWLISHQKPCGGFPHFAAADRLRALSSAWAGISALYFGNLDVAERAAAWCLKLLDQPEEGRFYFQTDTEGHLLTEAADPAAQHIDMAKTGQAYGEIGLPWMLMGRLRQATGDPKWSGYGDEFFHLQRSCAQDNFASVGSGSSSLAACIHFMTTGDSRARTGALSFGEFLLATHHPEGGWRGDNEPDTPLIYIDHAAEYSVWLEEIVGLLGSID